MTIYSRIILALLFLAQLTVVDSISWAAATKKKAPAQKPSEVNSQTLTEEIDSIGDQAIVERAQKLSPNNQVEVVQKRAVNRRGRMEIGVDYGLIGGGDSYLASQNFGGHLDYHITPRWSVGVRYSSFINSLTAEGQNAFNNAREQHITGNGGQAGVSPVDSPIQSGLFLVNWYPVYGKMNIFSWIPHFDIYLLGGYGKTETENNGWSNTWTAGGGFGFWLNNFLALRLEGRYQTYQDRPSVYFNSRQTNIFIGQAALGILL